MTEAPQYRYFSNETAARKISASVCARKDFSQNEALRQWPEGLSFMMRRWAGHGRPTVAAPDQTGWT